MGVCQKPVYPGGRSLYSGFTARHAITRELSARMRTLAIEDLYGGKLCAALRGLKSNNGFWLSQAGQDLLVTDGFGSYSYLSVVDASSLLSFYCSDRTASSVRGRIPLGYGEMCHRRI